MTMYHDDGYRDHLVAMPTQDQTAGEVERSRATRCVQRVAAEHAPLVLAALGLGPDIGRRKRHPDRRQPYPYGPTPRARHKTCSACQQVKAAYEFTGGNNHCKACNR